LIIGKKINDFKKSSLKSAYFLPFRPW